MREDLKLQQIFNCRPELAWQFLEAECAVYDNCNIKIPDIMKLSELYMTIIETLNNRQDTREKYFMNRMHKIMSEPFVIRCFARGAENKLAPLDHKRKEIEQKIAATSQQCQPELVKHLIKQQQSKEEKINVKINQIINEHEKNLERRIRKRAMCRKSEIMTDQFGHSSEEFGSEGLGHEIMCHSGQSKHSPDEFQHPSQCPQLQQIVKKQLNPQKSQLPKRKCSSQIIDSTYN